MGLDCCTKAAWALGLAVVIGLVDGWYFRLDYDVGLFDCCGVGLVFGLMRGVLVLMAFGVAS